MQSKNIFILIYVYEISRQFIHAITVSIIAQWKYTQGNESIDQKFKQYLSANCNPWSIGWFLSERTAQYHANLFLRISEILFPLISIACILNNGKWFPTHSHHFHKYRASNKFSGVRVTSVCMPNQIRVNMKYGTSKVFRALSLYWAICSLREDFSPALFVILLACFFNQNILRTLATLVLRKVIRKLGEQRTKFTIDGIISNSLRKINVIESAASQWTVAFVFGWFFILAATQPQTQTRYE